MREMKKPDSGSDTQIDAVLDSLERLAGVYGLLDHDEPKATEASIRAARLALLPQLAALAWDEALPVPEDNEEPNRSVVVAEVFAEAHARLTVAQVLAAAAKAVVYPGLEAGGGAPDSPAQTADPVRVLIQEMGFEPVARALAGSGPAMRLTRIMQDGAGPGSH